MRLVILSQFVALMVTFAVLGDETRSSSAELPKPITTRQTVFAIPFKVDKSGRTTVEVRLYVSSDRGANWEMCDKVAPEKSQFLFRAPNDGEYWFLISTVDRSGQIRPQRSEGPGLRVVVDTTLPELQVQARQEDAGQVAVRWRAVDPSLDLDKLKIQYRFEVRQPWQSVAVDRQAISSAGPMQTGEEIWWPEGNSQTMEIRAEVSDTAGNLAVSHAQLKLARRPAQQPGTPENSTPDADPKLARMTERSTQWRAPDGSFPSNGSTGGSTIQPMGPPDERESQADNWGGPGQRETRIIRGPQEVFQDTALMAADVNPPIRSQYLPQQQKYEPQRQQPADISTPVHDLPSGGRPEMVNSRRIELDYQIDQATSLDVARVELWGTRDGGRTWTSYGVDDDNRSPMLVNLNEEGIHGLRIAVSSGSGSPTGRPQSGALPDVQIGVDLTKPVCRILSTELGTGDRAGQMLIRWEAFDQALSPLPVSLYLADSPTGPWTTIAAGLANTQQYVWPIDRRPIDRVYLRLEVRDEAGNVGVFDTPEAIQVGSARPTVRINAVRPVVESARLQPRRYNFGLR